MLTAHVALCLNSRNEIAVEQAAYFRQRAIRSGFVLMEWPPSEHQTVVDFLRLSTNSEAASIPWAFLIS